MIDARTAQPVTPDASPEAVALLQFLLDISGRRVLAGQHAAPQVVPRRLDDAYRTTGRFPALLGLDFGFSPPGTWDGIDFRERTIDEAIRRHREGFVITLMWHAVRPIEDEPVSFERSIQGTLTDDQWCDLLTPETAVHARWAAQVDVIASRLARLRDARVPVLWRPYHEMNGGWFWWGRRRAGEYRALYRMLFDRLARVHALNNLLWVYNCNELGPLVDPYATHYPGDDVVDVLATDVYHHGFAQRDYDELLGVAADKPIAIGECGAAPPAEVLTCQPRWTWFMIWSDPNEEAAGPVRQAYAHPRTVTHEQLPWVASRRHAGS